MTHTRFPSHVRLFASFSLSLSYYSMFILSFILRLCCVPMSHIDSWRERKKNMCFFLIYVILRWLDFFSLFIRSKKKLFSSVLGGWLSFWSSFCKQYGPNMKQSFLWNSIYNCSDNDRISWCLLNLKLTTLISFVWICVCVYVGPSFLLLARLFNSSHLLNVKREGAHTK